MKKSDVLLIIVGAVYVFLLAFQAIVALTNLEVLK